MADNDDETTLAREEQQVGLPLERVYEFLCNRDSRNPLCLALHGWGESDDELPPRVNCFCDNCFYGRDKLALEILRLHGEQTI